MAGLFGGKKNSSNIPRYTSLQLQTSAQGVVIPIGWGKFRLGTNLIWYGDFQSIPQKQKAGKGGGGGSVTSYNYKTAAIMGLCEGEIQSVPQVWAGRSNTTIAALGMTLFTGTQAQAAWSYMTSRHPTQAMPYAGLGYLAVSAYELGSSPNLPSHTFEVVGYLSGSMPYGSLVDANPKDIAYDYLTNAYYGLGFTSAFIDDWTDWYTYCRAAGIFFSPILTEQEQAVSTLQRWADLSNTWIFWNGEKLRALPLGTEEITANGVTFTPVITPIYNLGVDDFQSDSGGSPVIVKRKDPADCHNRVQLDILDRSNQYNNSSVLWTDQALVDQFGLMPANVVQAHEICVREVALYLAGLICKREAYIRNTYTFMLDYTYILLEPGDIVTLTEPNIGLVSYPVRITAVEETETGMLQFEAEEFPAGIGQTAAYSTQEWDGSVGIDVNVDPGDVNPPAIFEPDSSATGGVPQIWLSLSGGEWWGGADIYVSFDAGTSYSKIGTTNSPATQGELTADLPSASGLDVTNVLAVDLAMSLSTIPATATSADADALRTLCLVGQEVLAYGTAASGMTEYEFDLSYLQRAAYGSSPDTHLAGTLFTRFDPETTFTYDLPLEYVGASLKFKFVSYNSFNQAYQDISLVTEYDYTPNGTGYYIAPPTSPTIGASRITQADGTTFIQIAAGWTASVGPNLGSYEIQVSADSGATWGPGLSVGAGTVQYNLMPALASTNYQIRIRAISQNGVAISAWATTAVQSSGDLVVSVPSAPAGLSTVAYGSAVLTAWNTSSDNTILRYEVWRAAGTGLFGVATKVQDNGVATSWFDNTTAASTQYTYYIVAVNAAGSSSPSAGSTVTTGAFGAGQPYDVIMSYIGTPSATTTYYRAAIPRAVSFTSSSEWVMAAETAPIANYTVTFYKNGVSWATGTILAGATTGTFSATLPTNFAAADILEAEGPSDASLVNLTIALVGAR